MTTSITIEPLKFKKQKAKQMKAKMVHNRLTYKVMMHSESLHKNIFDKSWENYLRALLIDRQTILYLE